jgi:protein-S-isoprenylcysteine O-methyltransferase Ste14
MAKAESYSSWERLVRGFRIVTTRLAAVMVVAVLLLGTPPYHERGLLEQLLKFSGLLFVLVGTFGRLWSTLYIAGYKTSSLITVGPYSVVRHPLYFFSFVGGLGLALSTEMLTIIGLYTLLFGIYYPTVIRLEERRLGGLHGPELAAYRARVPAFIPKWSLFQEPENYQVNTRLFRRSLLDGMWFIIAYGGLELCQVLHRQGVLPNLFLVP